MAAAGLPQGRRTGNAVSSTLAVLADPSQLLGLLSSIGGQVTTVGNVDLDGVQTTEYPTTVTVSELAARAGLSTGSGLGARVAKVLGQLGNTSVPVTAWVGTDGYVRQLSASLDLSRATLGGLAGDLVTSSLNGSTSGQSTSATDVTVGFSHYGAPVDVTAPPASQVTDVQRARLLAPGHRVRVRPRLLGHRRQVLTAPVRGRPAPTDRGRGSRPVRSCPMARAYDVIDIEKKWQRAGATRAPTRSMPTTRGPRGTCSPCTPTRRAPPTWATSATTPSATCWSGTAPCSGYAVLSPFGFDSFGLPAENAAIKTGTHPRIFTDARIDELKESITSLGAVYDWRREIRSHDPEYIKWNQVIFPKLLEAGLAYRANAPVNWCPGCQTVLANEQVLADGTCERSGDLVVKRDLEQWFFRITDYADELLAGLDDLDWPERVKTMQRNWIGRSEGAEFDLVVEGRDGSDGREPLALRVFTTRPDTSFGMTYAVVAPEHPHGRRADHARARERGRRAEVRAAASTDVERMSESGAASLAKRGAFTGSSVVNPFTGDAGARSTWPTTCSWATAPAPSWPCRPRTPGTGTSPRPTGCPSCARCSLPRAGTSDGGPRGRWRYTGTGREDQQPRGSTAWTSRRPRPGPSSGWRSRASASARSTTGCGTGWCRASGSGAARSPSSTAPTTASSRCPPTSCRCWPPTTSSSCRPVSRRWPPIPASSTPPARSAAARPPARPTPWTPSWTRRGTSCASPTPGRPTPRSTRRSPATGCRSTSTSAASSTPSSTCSTPASTPRPWSTWVSAPEGLREPFARLFTQGMIRMDGTKMSKSKGNLVAPSSYLTTVGADALRLFHLFVAPPADDVDWSDQTDSVIDGCARYLDRVWRLAVPDEPVPDQRLPGERSA